MAAKNFDLFSNKDKRLFSNLKKAEIDYIKENTMLVQETAKGVLKLHLPDSDLSLVTTLMLKRAEFELNNPRFIDIKAWAAVVDDKKVDKVDADISASEVFKGIKAVGVIKSDSNRSKKE